MIRQEVWQCCIDLSYTSVWTILWPISSALPGKRKKLLKFMHWPRQEHLFVVKSGCDGLDTLCLCFYCSLILWMVSLVVHQGWHRRIPALLIAWYFHHSLWSCTWSPTVFEWLLFRGMLLCSAQDPLRCTTKRFRLKIQFDLLFW